MTVPDYVDFAESFARAVGITRCILMGHSHGGRVALSLLEDPACPVRFPRAILMDAAGVRLPASPGQKGRQTAYKLLKTLGTSRLTAPLFGDLYEQERNKRSSADYRAATPVMRETMKNVLPCDLREHMPDITAQVLLIWGENDTATPLSHGRIMEERIPGAGLAVIRGAGHFCFAGSWPQFSAVLRAVL